MTGYWSAAWHRRRKFGTRSSNSSGGAIRRSTTCTLIFGSTAKITSIRRGRARSRTPEPFRSNRARLNGLRPIANLRERPALAVGWLQVFIGLLVVGEPHLGGIPLQLAFHTERDDAKQHPFHKRGRHIEVGARCVAAFAG